MAYFVHTIRHRNKTSRENAHTRPVIAQMRRIWLPIANACRQLDLATEQSPSGARQGPLLTTLSRGSCFGALLRSASNT